MLQYCIYQYCTVLAGMAQDQLGPVPGPMTHGHGSGDTVFSDLSVSNIVIPPASTGTTAISRAAVQSMAKGYGILVVGGCSRTSYL